MTKKQAERVKVGDLIKWTGEGDPAIGEVVEVGYNAFKIKWPDDMWMMVGFADPGALKDVQKVK